MGYTFKYASCPSDRKTAMTNAYNSIILPNEGMMFFINNFQDLSNAYTSV
jgi:hypothetical protein